MLEKTQKPQAAPLLMYDGELDAFHLSRVQILLHYDML